MGSSPVQILAHPDPLRLQRELSLRIAALRSDPARRLDPLLVVAPSRRLVWRLRSCLAADLDSALALEVVTFFGLARCLGASPGARLAPGALLEALVQGLALGQESGLARYVASHPTAVPALAGVLGELREALVDPEILEERARTGMEKDLAALYFRYLKALSKLGAEGWLDRAGWMEGAMHLDAPVTRYRAVFVFGAYDLIGTNLALLRSLAPSEGTTFLVPADLDSPAWSHAKAFLERHLPADASALHDDAPRPFVRLARALPGWGSSPGTIPGLRLVNVQGPEAEITLVAREALALIARGEEPARIGIVARSLEPYADIAETVFERHGLHIDASAGHPAIRYPRTQAFLLLARSLAHDFERQTVLDLLRSPLLRRRGDTAWDPDRWELWSRRLRLVRGETAWKEDIVLAVAAESARPRRENEVLDEALDQRSALLLAETIGELAGERGAWQSCRDASDHARFLRGLLERRLEPPEGDDDLAVSRTMNEALDELASLDAAHRVVPSPHEGLSPKEVLDYLESRLATTDVPWSSAGGVAFLDAMQARGLTFRHVFAIGLGADLWPRRARESLFLSDATRRALRTERRPLSLASESEKEERLLLAQVIASAEETLTLTWQRADAEGKVKPVSPYLREIARCLPVDLSDESIVLRLPTHPAEAAAWLRDRTGLLTLEEAALAACDRASDPVATLRGMLDGDVPAEASACLDAVAALQDYSGGTLAYDGSIGAPAWDRPFSVSSLERLGACPQTFFFQYVLGIRPLTESAEDRTVEMDEVGIAFHAVLEAVMKDLNAEGLLDGTRDAETLRQAAGRSLDERWEEVLESASRRMQRHLPALWTWTAAMWREEIDAFLEKDLTRLAEGRHTFKGSEVSFASTKIDLARGADLAKSKGYSEAATAVTVSGRADRITRDAGGTLWISDYKTSGNLKKRVNPAEYLSGRKVQLPLYSILAEGLAEGGPVVAEFLGLGPWYRPDRGYARGDDATLDAEDFVKNREAFEETLSILSGLVERGRFPFRKDHSCIWCPYRPACRRFHDPSRERVQTHPDFAGYHAVSGKGAKSPLVKPREEKKP